MKIGEKLVAGRHKLGFTQQEVADKLFVTRQTVSQWENDQRKPDLDALSALCRLLQLDARVVLAVGADDFGTMNELLGKPVFADISKSIMQQPAYMNATIEGQRYPQRPTPGWLNRVTAGYKLAVGEADFDTIVTLKDEHGVAFYQELPERLTISLVQSPVFPIGMMTLPEMKYRTLVTIGARHLLIPTAMAAPVLLDWAQRQQVHVQDPLQLFVHRKNIDFNQLTQAEFDHLTAGTPYAFAYQQGGGSMAPW